jgi:hypothetical protein
MGHAQKTTDPIRPGSYGLIAGPTREDNAGRYQYQSSLLQFAPFPSSDSWSCLLRLLAVDAMFVAVLLIHQLWMLSPTAYEHPWRHPGGWRCPGNPARRPCGTVGCSPVGLSPPAVPSYSPMAFLHASCRSARLD